MDSSDDDYQLTDNELRHVQSIINAAKPGRYTLRQLFGKKRWDTIGDDGAKRDYGARFWQSYERKKLQGIVESGHKSNSLAYSLG